MAQSSCTAWGVRRGFSFFFPEANGVRVIFAWIFVVAIAAFQIWVGL
jgi:hypothetical protein